MASATAEYMALFRALESTAPPEARLFDDPYATRFLRRSLGALVRLSGWRLGRSLVRRALDALWPGARASGVARTRLIDDTLVAAASKGHFEQFVFLGAGFDCRAHRRLLGSTPTIFEVDREETQALKRRFLSGHATRAVRYVPCDFAVDSLASRLARAGFRLARPTFFVWEGVTNYLDRAAVEAVLDYVSASAPGSALLFTYVDRRVLDEPDRFAGAKRLRTMLQRSSESWTFGLAPAEVAVYLARRGLELVWDEGSVDYRSRYLGSRGPHLRGYEFYRVAVAAVARHAAGPSHGASECPK